ncbi:MAG: EAL domain-containing protein [Pseudomonadota bacterium]
MTREWTGTSEWTGDKSSAARRLFRSNSLRAQIMLLFLAAIVLVALLTLYLTQEAAYQHSKTQLDAHHLAGSRVVADRLETRATLLRDGLNDLSGNFSVKQLVSSGQDDPASLVVAMENYRQRLGADMYIVLDGDGAILTSSISITEFEYEPSAYSNPGLSWADFLERHYLVKAAPLRYVQNSPKVNAWIVMGQLSDNLIDEKLVALTGMQVSLVEVGATPSVWGSTLDVQASNELAAALSTAATDAGEIMLGEQAVAIGVNQLAGQPILETVVSTSLDSAYLPYQSLLLRLIIVLLLAVLLSAVAVMRISRSITQPIDKLVAAANRISRGEEARDLPRRGTREVSVLSRAIEDMQDGIREREEEINRLAYFDSLTGLPNRNQFVSRLTRVLREEPGKKITIALLDLDEFKEINDTVGHATGDLLLNMIAERFKSWKEPGDFLARIGGDEFALITQRFADRDPRVLGTQIANIFESPFALGGLHLDVNASIGLTVSPQHGQEAQSLLQRADIAMYSCKRSHDHFAVYEDSLDQHSVQRLSLMSELKEALTEGQLYLQYQPKLSLTTGKVGCAECLIRWEHPRFGLVRPDEFIPLAEQTGAIRYVTQWAIKTALEQQASWRAQGIELELAVNISAVDVADLSLPAYVGELQSKLALPSDSLTLEITESAVMGDPDTAILALRNLRKMGVKLSIDDFGTGFSSMAQLKRMPVNELKIDKAFVQKLAENADDRIMVKTLVSLARNLGLETVAEGVEDEGSLSILAEMQCDRAQGYHISRPKSVEQFEDWLLEQQDQSRVANATG